MIKIYCDTDTLLHNAHVSDAKELEALKTLLKARPTGLCSMVRSRVVLREVEATRQPEKRDLLRADYDALEQIDSDERVLGFASSRDQLGGEITFPFVSDVQDDELLAALMQGGLKLRDAQHITQAKCNGCNVFLTRDRQIIKRRGWVEGLTGLKVRLPSEMASELV